MPLHAVITTTALFRVSNRFENIYGIVQQILCIFICNFPRSYTYFTIDKIKED